MGILCYTRKTGDEKDSPLRVAMHAVQHRYLELLYGYADFMIAYYGVAGQVASL